MYIFPAVASAPLVISPSSKKSVKTILKRPGDRVDSQKVYEMMRTWQFFQKNVLFTFGYSFICHFSSFLIISLKVFASMFIDGLSSRLITFTPT